MGADKSAENTQIPQNLSAQFVCPNPKVWDFDEKRLHWASVVRESSISSVVNCQTLCYEKKGKICPYVVVEVVEMLAGVFNSGTEAGKVPVASTGELVVAISSNDANVT